MKKVCFIGVILAVLGFSTLANANLVNNGNHLIYDTDLNLTWYDVSPGAMTWSLAKVWASNLTVNIGGTTYADWRLPTTPGPVLGYTNQGEMGHLYYDELHNVAGGPLNDGPFTNLQAAAYWTGTARNASYTFNFNFGNGYQGQEYMLNNNYVMAVHAGNVGAVPIPGTIFLFAPGLLGLAVLRRRWKR